MKNARFWEWLNGNPVKITLKPGQSLRWGQWRRTEEGYHQESLRWFYPDWLPTPCIGLEMATDGRDCDGRLSTYTELTCDLEELMANHNRHSGLDMPNWHRVSARQRDYQAEAAGY